MSMTNTTRQHVRDRLNSARRRTVTILHDQVRHGFDPLEHLPEVLHSPQYDTDIFVEQLVFDCAPQLPGSSTFGDTLVSRMAVAHLFGQQLHLEPPRQSRFEGAFVESAHDLHFSVNQVGIHRMLSENFDPSLTWLVAGFESYLPPTDLPDTMAPQITAHFARSAFTTLLEEYVPPQTAL